MVWVPVFESACARVEVCFDCALVFCFMMGYVLQFGEVTRQMLHYYHHHEITRQMLHYYHHHEITRQMLHYYHHHEITRQMLHYYHHHCYWSLTVHGHDIDSSAMTIMLRYCAVRPCRYLRDRLDTASVSSLTKKDARRRQVRGFI